MIGDPRLLDFARQGLLIVFDSLIRFHNAENENDASEMAKIMAQLRALANAGGTVLALHHKAKSETSSYRGSSDIAGAADVVFALAKREDQLELRAIKHRFAPEVTLNIRPDFAAGRFELTESPALAQRREEVEALTEIITSNPGMSKNQIVQRSGMGRNKVLALLDHHSGTRWKSRPGQKGALLYDPL